ncbi:MAG TPA: OmpA family protein [Planctomycetota bacterium]|nr:OmpA family protein [Planctomycetota bacterium]
MTKHRYLVLGMCAIVSLGMGGCGKNRDLAYAKVHISELERQIADLEGQLAEKNAELERLRAGGVPAQPVAAAEPGERNSDISEFDRTKEHVFQVESDVLFSPGKAVLTSKAKSTLDDVIRRIKAEYPNHDIRVEGHTDADPISRSKDLWEDNWDLAGGRARAVLHYLHDHGIPESKLGFAGYADQRPRGSDKPRNRRVEIVAIPK